MLNWVFWKFDTINALGECVKIDNKEKSFLDGQVWEVLLLGGKKRVVVEIARDKRGKKSEIKIERDFVWRRKPLWISQINIYISVKHLKLSKYLLQIGDAISEKKTTGITNTHIIIDLIQTVSSYFGVLNFNRKILK